MNAMYIAAIVAILLVAAVIALAFTRKRKARRDAFVLVGPSGAGKTTFFVRVRYGKLKPCYPSSKELDGTFVPALDPSSPPLHLIDLPGHPQLRFLVSHYLPIARAVLFFVDSSTFAKSIRDTAEALYDLLADPKVAPRVLIVCNKQDLWTSWGWERIKEELEKEINSLRTTRTASLSTLSPSAASEYLGIEGQPFSFDQLDTTVEFLECSAGSVDEEDDGIAKVLEWIRGE